MKKFTIPLVDKSFCIYIGSKEWHRFRAATIEEGAEEVIDAPCPGEGSGRVYGGHVWVFDITNRKILFHELSHFVDAVMFTLGSSDTEFRAYITEWVFDTMLKWVGTT